MSDSNWLPTAALSALQLRADILAQIREFFAHRSVLEVETPILSHSGTTDPHIESFRTAEEETRYLHTSPEFAMKRLLAAGSGSIYQICKVFRQEEEGARHNPEFTMLEWYRPEMDMEGLINEVDELVRLLLQAHLPLANTRRFSYIEAFAQFVGVHPLKAEVSQLAAAALQHDIHIEMSSDESERDNWLDLLMALVVEPALPRGGPVFIYNYPASQASLAKLDQTDPRLARRFELYLDGLELANGFDELTDADEQARRFAHDRQTRKKNGQPDVPVDHHLIAALEHGMPTCSGVALGLDRLLMLALKAKHIDEALAFSSERA
ncbi:MAG: EF-P lysine aminoacylase GenX [Gammaproteobacteria bacterium]|nr:EF-P lysine aminoacylase GenX [Gammaproteobacteria bacterium]